MLGSVLSSCLIGIGVLEPARVTTTWLFLCTLQPNFLFFLLLERRFCRDWSSRVNAKPPNAASGGSSVYHELMETPGAAGASFPLQPTPLPPIAVNSGNPASSTAACQPLLPLRQPGEPEPLLPCMAPGPPPPHGTEGRGQAQELSSTVGLPSGNTQETGFPGDLSL